MYSSRRRKSALGQQSSTSDPSHAQPGSPSVYLHPVEYEEIPDTFQSDDVTGIGGLHPIGRQEITDTPQSDYLHPIEYQETTATSQGPADPSHAQPGSPSVYLHPVEHEEIPDTFQSDDVTSIGGLHPIGYQEVTDTDRSDYLHPIEYQETTATSQRPADASANYELMQVQTTAPAAPIYTDLRQPDYVNCP